MNVRMMSGLLVPGGSGSCSGTSGMAKAGIDKRSVCKKKQIIKVKQIKLRFPLVD